MIVRLNLFIESRTTDLRIMKRHNVFYRANLGVGASKPRASDGTYVLENRWV